MDKIKPYLKYVIIAAILIFAGWAIYESAKRKKDRTNWINWMNALPNTDTWKAQIAESARKSGRTLDEEIIYTAEYLTPSNIFKKRYSA